MNYFHQIVENKYMSEAPIEKLFESGRAAFKFDGAWEVNTIYAELSGYKSWSCTLCSW